MAKLTMWVPVKNQYDMKMSYKSLCFLSEENSTKNLTYFNTLLEPFLELKKAQKTLDMSQIHKTNRPSLGCTENLYFDIL